MFDLLVRLCLILSIIVFVAGIAVMVMSLASYVIGGAPYEATPLHVLNRMLEVAAIRPGDKVYDLGCGDGRLIIDAHKEYGAVAVGIEISPFFCWVARLKARLARAEVTVLRGSFYAIDFSDADVVFCYLMPGQMKRLAARFTGLQPECRIVSLRFEVPGWQPTICIGKDPRRAIPAIRVYRAGDHPA